MGNLLLRRGFGGRYAAASVALFLLLLVSPVFAQLPEGTILGVVKDTSGGVVAGATVTIQNADTGQSRTATTGEDGSYRVPALAVGNYTVKFEKDGFKSLTQQGLVLTISQEMVVNAALQVGASTQEVVVTGEAPLVNTTDSTTGGLVNEQQMADLPLNGRNYVDLALLQPGVQQQVMPTGGGAGAAGVFFSSDGAGIRSNNFTIDGAMMVNSFGGSTSSEAGTTLGVDGIKEYKVVTHTFTAEYGMTVGSQVTIVSKGGTNNWHGDAFEYIRNSSMDARNFFDTGWEHGGPRLPEFQRNNFGGSFGGPIKKDKTFFYAVYEGLRENLGVTETDTVMPAACHDLVNPGTNNTTLANPGACTSGIINPIPQVIQPWLAQFPLPNLPNNQFTYPASARIRVDFGQMRFDQTISASDTFFARYTIDDSFLTNPGTVTLLVDTEAEYPQFAVTGASRNQFLTLSENHIFSATVLNQFRVSWSRTNLVPNNVVNTTSLNPQGALVGPQYAFIPGYPMGSLSVGSGITTFGPNTSYPGYHIFDIGTLSDDLFYTKGKHAFKFGTLLNRENDPNYQQFTTSGSVSFPSLAGFMQGTASQISAQTAYTSPSGPGCVAPCGVTYPFVNQHDYIWNTLGFYAEDDWRARPNLTLNLGLRYEIMTDLHELSGTESCIPNVATSDTFKYGCLINNYTLGNWMPRVGFAWDVFGDGKTALRGGAGIYYDVGNISAGINFTNPNGTPPYVGRSSENNPPGVLTIPFSFAPSAQSTMLRTIDDNIKSPRSTEYSLTLERQLPFNFGLSVGYVGLRGTHIWSLTDGNPCVPTAIVNGIPNWTNATNTICPNGRINKYWSAGNLYTTSPSNSWYNGLQVALTQRLTHGLQVQGSYAYSHSEDTVQGQQAGLDCQSNLSTGDNPIDQDANKQPSCFDLRHVIRANVLYNLPTVKSDSIFAKVVNGWWVSSIVSVQGGYPLTPALSNTRSLSSYQGGTTDLANEVTSASTQPLTVGAAPPGAAVAPNCAGTTCTYNFVPYNQSGAILGTANNWFNPLMFDLQPDGYLGNAPRGIIRGPGLRDWDFALNKDTALPFLGEAGKLQFRAEIFNLLNHANLGLPGTGTPTVYTGVQTVAPTGGYQAPVGATAANPLGTAGQITTTVGTSRQIQLALKVIF